MAQRFPHLPPYLSRRLRVIAREDGVISIHFSDSGRFWNKICGLDKPIRIQPLGRACISRWRLHTSGDCGWQLRHDAADHTAADHTAAPKAKRPATPVAQSIAAPMKQRNHDYSLQQACKKRGNHRQNEVFHTPMPGKRTCVPRKPFASTRPHLLQIPFRSAKFKV